MKHAPLNLPAAVWSGTHMIDLAAPDPALIEIADIAYGLSNMPRWTGRYRGACSVAEHSIAVSCVAFEIAPPGVAGKRLQLAALLHDAPEYLLADVPAPAKCLCPDYARIEARLMAAIVTRFGLTTDPAALAVIAEADARCAATEKQTYFPDAPFEIDALPHSMGIYRCLDPEAAFMQFARFWGIYDQ